MALEQLVTKAAPTLIEQLDRLEGIRNGSMIAEHDDASEVLMRTGEEPIFL